MAWTSLGNFKEFAGLDLVAFPFLEPALFLKCIDVESSPGSKDTEFVDVGSDMVAVQRPHQSSRIAQKHIGNICGLRVGIGVISHHRLNRNGRPEQKRERVQFMNTALKEHSARVALCEPTPVSVLNLEPAGMRTVVLEANHCAEQTLLDITLRKNQPRLARTMFVTETDQFSGFTRRLAQSGNFSDRCAERLFHKNMKPPAHRRDGELRVRVGAGADHDSFKAWMRQHDIEVGVGGSPFFSSCTGKGLFITVANGRYFKKTGFAHSFAAVSSKAPNADHSNNKWIHTF